MAKKKAAKKSRPVRVWMLVPTEADVAVLRQRIAAKGPLWDQWTYKLARDRILIYDSVGTIDPATNRFDPQRREPQLHLRISPVPQGPFELEFRRHNDTWASLWTTGTIEQLADAIAGGKVPMTQPMDQGEHDRQTKG